MSGAQIEEVFLRHNAGRHFVALTYRLQRGGAVHEDLVASCFVVDVAGVWYLLTAGHWLKHEETGLERLTADGFRIDKIFLVDEFAGHSGVPLPFSFELSDWMAIYDEDKGRDFAALPIHAFHRRGLESVGVSAIEPHAIGPADFVDDSQLVLAGVPAESLRRLGADRHLKFLLVPLTKYRGDDLPPKGDSLLACMAENPPEPLHQVDDIRGMSGCPVFRVVTKAGHQKKYWLVGIQSGWYASRRVVRFCPIDAFVEALHEVERIRSIGPDAEGV